MRYIWTRLKKQLLRLAAICGVFGAAFLVILYLMGYYDLSFLDRYNFMNELNTIDALLNEPPANRFESLFTPPDLDEESDISADGSTGMSDSMSFPSAPDSAERGGTAGQNTSGGSSRADGAQNIPQSYETSSVKGVFDEKRLPDRLVSSKKNGSATVGELLAEGYSVMGSSYSEGGLIYARNNTASKQSDAEKDDGDSSAEDKQTVFVTSEKFAPGSTVLGRLELPVKLPNKYSLSARTVKKANINYPDDDSEYYVTYSDITEKRPAVELYMGYIIIDSGRGKLTYLASDGTVLCSADSSVYTPANERDKYDRPLFTKPAENGGVYYMYLSEDGHSFVSTSYDRIAEGRGLRFDYPASYGSSDSTVVYTDKSKQTGLMGYLIKDKGMLTTYSYTKAYPFTSNRGAVTTAKNRGGMFFVDENGNQAFPTWYSYINEYDRYVFNNLMPPATDGIENIGFYYFEYGLTRVRRQVIDNWNWSRYRRVRVVVDESILIRPDGSEYTLPAGYSLEGYSDGMMLLSKNGKYGFTDYTGEWIAQPIYTAATPFVGGLATLTTSDGRVGAIDTEGNIVLQFTYDHISFLSDSVIAAYREQSGWTVLRMMKPKK